MRPSCARLTLVSLLALLVLPPAAWADNTSFNTPHSLMIGGTPAEAFLGATSPQRWYITNLVANRSYCVETQGGVLFDTDPFAAIVPETSLAVYRSDLTTVIGVGSNTISSEPGGSLNSRVCFIAPATEGSFIQVTRGASSSNFNFRVRIVETTFFSNLFFLGGDYNAFTIIRNTTSAAVDVTVRWRNLAGTELAATTTSVPANGGTFLNARDFVPSPATNPTGNVEIAHTGSPSAIMATGTILSSTTGLMFNTIFVQRQPW